MIPHIPFYFLRHGETDWNLASKMMGMADIPLNATGRSQAERARATISGLELRSIAVSSLSRARQTADIINDGLSLALIPFDDLREVDVGPLGGVSDRNWMSRWYAGEAIEGVESFSAFCTRIGRGVGQALKLEHPVLIVSHGGVFHAIEHLIGRRQATDIPNATLVRLEPPAPERHSWRVILA